MSTSPASVRLRRKRGCLWLLLILLSISAAILVLDEYAPTWWIERKVATSGPGAGASRGEVEMWLDRQGISRARCSDVSKSGGYPAQTAPWEFRDLAPVVQGEYIVGKVIVTHIYSWVSEVWIYFLFDSNGLLLQHIVRRWERYL